MKFQLKVRGSAELDATHRATIESDLPGIEALKFGTDDVAFLRLEKQGKSCGCILLEVKSGNANEIVLDRFKQRHLNVKDGGVVDVEAVVPNTAERIELSVPPDFSERDVIRFIGKPLTRNEKTAVYVFSGGLNSARVVTVSNAKPDGIVLVSTSTQFITSIMKPEVVPIHYSDIGGLDREIRQIREVVEYPFRYNDVFEHLGVSQPKGLILYGPPGTGKTLIAKALANEVGANFMSISGPEVYSTWVGESERKLREIFDEAEKKAPSVILIDEIDALAPKRGKSTGEVEPRLVATLLTLMDGLRQLKGVVVVGTTNRLNSIDEALRREGRFGHEIHIGVPDLAGRKQILKIQTVGMPLFSDVNLDIIADRTAGFVGADLAAVCREAAYNALRRTFPAVAFERGEVNAIEDLTVNQLDFEKAVATIPPSAMKELLVEVPKVTWSDIGGLEEIKKLLIENISYSISKREVFKQIGLKPAKGILLYGPPGTGKTLLAKAVANQCGVNFIAVKGPEIHSKWVGESEERIRFLFAKAREVAPCVIFFDEIDAVAPNRSGESQFFDTLVNQVLSEMDGIENSDGVYVIGATNRVEMIDPAILRPGRFDYLIYVPIPDPTTRKAIFEVHLRSKPLSTDFSVDEAVRCSEGFSGAEIMEACRQATWTAIREANFQAENFALTTNHLKNAIASIAKTKSNLTGSNQRRSYVG
ncbi:MAG: AAA family ATPase [Candidatus Bathyarchaeota archaeon]|nr:AAA family ATPase [Candidatus Bathyarchaeota archaeon]